MDTVRVLVVYGSTRGGTAGLAHLVADAFVRHHIHAEVRRAGEVRSFGDYDAVIVGGALYSNRWHPDATAFVGRNRAELRRLPVWFFSSGPLDDSARSGAIAPVPQVNSLAREIEIRGHMTFGGLLDKRPAGLFGLFAYGPEGDFRDRHHVSEWVERIAEELRHEHESMIRVVDSTGRTVPPKAAPRRPPIVIVPMRDPEDLEAATSNLDGHDVDGLREDVQISWSEDDAPRPVRSLSRLRNYLTLDDEEAEDEGLDLLLELAEP
ncbi:MAG TPA: flavodoxin domain-containing protein [Mycobacteriales bacterium]|nr:flavodoxin domain-containing protein [Mycobacteriales bacterium]